MTVAVLHLQGWGRQNGSEHIPRKSLAAGRDSPKFHQRLACASCNTPLWRPVKANIRPVGLRHLRFRVRSRKCAVRADILAGKQEAGGTRCGAADGCKE